MDRARESRAHREMVGAWTTAAVINSGMCRPEDPVNALEYMPSHRAAATPESDADIDEEELQKRSDYNLKVLQLAAEMRAGKGPLLERVERGESV